MMGSYRVSTNVDVDLWVDASDLTTSDLTAELARRVFDGAHRSGKIVDDLAKILRQAGFECIPPVVRDLSTAAKFRDESHYRSWLLKARAEGSVRLRGDLAGGP